MSMRRWKGVVAALCVLALIGGAYGIALIRHGFSATDEPSAMERVVARAVRNLAIPSRAAQEANPWTATPELLSEARETFLDRCATCHGEDGSGQTAVGRNIYPKPPDLRAPLTQKLSDGEIHYIIRNGIRLTGMPAWGEQRDDNDEDGWKLVHFIRHLSELTPAQLKEMEKLNPKTAAELEEERQDEEFLRGGALAEPAPTGPATPSQPHKH